MRFIHTADWHLGRIFHGVHLTEDQDYMLNQLITLAKEIKADAVLISGDVYDRAVPPPEAVALLDEVLSRLLLEVGVSVVMIAGNHDSPIRLGFGSRILSDKGLHVVSSLADITTPIVLHDQNGAVHLYGLPFAELAVMREGLGEAEVNDYDQAMRSIVTQIRNSHPRRTRSILMGHAFVVGGEESESERPLSVGGAAVVEASCFEGFHYVALGHLHRPQKVDGGEIHYPGSLLKYSFAEAAHTKSINLVEMDAHGVCQVEQISFTPRHEVRCLKGNLKELLMGPPPGISRHDYIMVSLLDREPILDPIGKLRTVYPQILNLERPYLTVSGEIRGVGEDHRKLSDAELFGAFFSQVTGEELTEAQGQAYAGIVEELYRREREVAL
jgi:exonuclease SbcD